jgi:hypothetical protein
VKTTAEHLRRACILIGAGVAAATIVSAAGAQQPAPPAGAAPPAAGARPPRAPPPAPVANLTGNWVLASEKDKPTKTLVLKQTGGVITGELKLATTPNGLPPVQFRGTMEGSQFDVMSLFDYDGGELVHIRGEYKDGHLVAKWLTIHSAPRKWRIDADTAEDYVRAS